MSITSKMENNSLYVLVTGDVDHHNVKKIREEIDELIMTLNPREVNFDLSKVDFMDSSGLGLVLGRYKKQTETGGTLKILNPTKRIAKILQLAGVDKIIKIEKRIV